MITFVGLGWEKRIRKIGYSHLLLIDKSLIIGNQITSKKPLYYFLIEHDNRKALLVYLDGHGSKVSEKIS